MQRKTLTTLGQLREGDRFTFLRKDDVWQVMSKTENYTNINQVSSSGTIVHKFDDMKKSGKQVIFLRHTQPQPGEECLAGDLKPGDMFTTGNILLNWIVDEITFPKVLATTPKTAQWEQQKKEFQHSEWVVFIGKNEEVTA